MIIEKTPLKDLLLITPRLFPDQRGYFFESYNKRNFALETGLEMDFVQDNEAKSTKGVLRGLHYQLPPFAQSKLVRVIEGEVLDVAVDIRPSSPSYGRYFSILLSAGNKKQLFIPKGFAHGYVVLSDSAIFSYKCDAFYNSDAEAGIVFNDEKLNIDWKLDGHDCLLSAKDRALPIFGKHKPFMDAYPG